MPFLSPHRLAGPGYIILNVLRVMNIVGLLSIIAASVVMLAKLGLESNVSVSNRRSTSEFSCTVQFFFFDAVSHVVTVFVSSKSRHIDLVLCKTTNFLAKSSSSPRKLPYSAPTLHAIGHC